MGFTTIIEINNDRLSEIELNPQGFVEALSQAVSYSSGLVPGGKVVAVFHRSDTGDDTAWVKFKKKMGWK